MTATPRMRLKKNYSSREVTALTGLSAKQLQWWDTHRIASATIAPHRTAAGGFTERRYSPVDLLELLVLADLRRKGLTVGKIRKLLATLRDRFGVRLFETIGGDGRVKLLTNGREIYARTASGQFFDLLNDPTQPLLVIGDEQDFRELGARVRSRRKKKARPVPSA
jgi:DNA-binding transcriptional MerR regulator